MANLSSNQAKIEIRTTASLAEHLGLSRWTISRVLNGHPGVKEETVRRVHAAMKELGFSPNPIARGLRGGRTRLIGVCFMELETPVLVKKTMALQKVLRDKGYQAIIEMTGQVPEMEQQVVKSFTALKVDGIVLVGSSLNPEGSVVSDLARRQIPVVAVDPSGELPFPRVQVDRALAYRQLLVHLGSRAKKKRIAVLGIHEGVIYGRDRLRGIREGAEALGIDFEEDLEMLYDPSREDLFYQYGYDLGEELLSRKSLPGGILCLNDQIALGCLRRLARAGISVPGDVCLTGFDNLDITQFTTPSLTTTAQQVPQLMAEAAELLLTWVKGGTKPSTRIRYVPPQLIVRESTGG